MFSFTTLFLIATLFTVCECSCCQNGWTRYDDSCYLIGYEQNMTFVEAEHYCRQHNGHLIHVDSAEENLFIIDIMQKTKASFCWVGISDMDVEGLWQWYDTKENAGFTYWTPGEPAGGKNEDCGVYATHQHKYHWDDYPCDAHFHPLCESSTDDTNSIVGK